MCRPEDSARLCCARTCQKPSRILLRVAKGSTPLRWGRKQARCHRRQIAPDLELLHPTGCRRTRQTSPMIAAPRVTTRRSRGGSSVPDARTEVTCRVATLLNGMEVAELYRRTAELSVGPARAAATPNSPRTDHRRARRRRRASPRWRPWSPPYPGIELGESHGIVDRGIVRQPVAGLIVPGCGVSGRSWLGSL